VSELREAPSGASRRVPAPVVVGVPRGPGSPGWVDTPMERIRPPEAGRVRLRLVVAYNGAPFRGVAPQPGLVTVGGELLDAVAKVLRQPNGVDDLVLVMSGRTDAGVHAWCQVVHVDVVPPAGGLGRGPRLPGQVVQGIDLERVVRSLNAMLAPHIAIRAADIASPHFDARFSASWRRYRYTVLQAPTPDPFLHGLAWHVSDSLDLSLMRLASDAFIGAHDFAAFCKAPDLGSSPGSTTERVVTDARWVVCGGGVLQFEIQALAFCQQMVRSIVGYIVDVGRGRRSAGDVLATMASKKRHNTLAPVEGLCLWDVGYPDEFALPLPAVGDPGSGWRPRP
jgi:tRNA pseudouridine38-40 synthase